MNPSERRVQKGPKVTSESESQEYEYDDKILEGLATLRAFHEALRDLSVITETLIGDLEFLLRREKMDRAWDKVMK